LTITGTAGDWLGAEMHGGTVEVHGAVGHGAGAGYRGSRHGMTGGCIWLQASAGDELGSQMRRGLIVAEGRVGAFAGANLIAGTIVLLSGAGHQLGAGMKRGTILACGPAQPSAGFRFSCDFAPQILPLLAKTVRNLGCQAFPDPPPMTVQCHRGDVLTGGKGEIWIPGRE
jgi:formylmethanofuran dehydrogenase subunit C